LCCGRSPARATRRVSWTRMRPSPISPAASEPAVAPPLAVTPDFVRPERYSEGPLVAP
jgi:hypothetical protein